ncbi:hypothetical protein [Streptomyces sp. NPDC057257]|uniref:hypothetical protein n=1 Tax=Streptomyces sp. NPDC057257 TaxID=3346071 RepID=UPI00363303F7
MKDASDAVLVKISGPSLVAVLTRLGDVQDDSDADLGTRAIAGLLHERIAKIVEASAPSHNSGSAPDRVRIDIDDRVGPPSEDSAEGPDGDRHAKEEGPEDAQGGHGEAA